MRGVDHRVGQVQGPGGTQFGQEHLVQALPYALFLPAGKPPPARRPGHPESRGGQLLPRDPVLSTNKIPAKAARSSRANRPG